MSPSPLLVAALLLLSTCVQGHFTFTRIAHNDVWQKPLQFIRNKTDHFIELGPLEGNTINYPREYDYPTQANDYPNSVRCGRGNMDHANGTEVLSVKAGDSFEVIATVWIDWSNLVESQWYGCPDNEGYCNRPPYEDGAYHNGINHLGPFAVFLSQVPAGQEVRAYAGDGEWVRIYTSGREMVNGVPEWIPNNGTSRFRFTIPKQTPAGQYLLRPDLIYPGAFATNDGVILSTWAQDYPSCVQLQVESDFSGTLPKGIHIPEDFCHNCTGMQIDYHKTSRAIYKYPGGPLWDGENMIEEDVPQSEPW